MERLKLYAMDGAEWLLRAVFEPGAVKSPVIGVGGLLVSLAGLKEWAQLIVAMGTAAIVMIHLVYFLMRIGCPLRRNQVKDCTACRLMGSALCPNKLNKEEL
jgi:hypothetical protein